ncbi:hypothetical protein ACJX0J_041079, partial [Zea mays]
MNWLNISFPGTYTLAGNSNILIHQICKTLAIFGKLVIEHIIGSDVIWFTILHEHSLFFGGGGGGQGLILYLGGQEVFHYIPFHLILPSQETKFTWAIITTSATLCHCLVFFLDSGVAVFNKKNRRAIAPQVLPELGKKYRVIAYVATAAIIHGIYTCAEFLCRLLASAEVGVAF